MGLPDLSPHATWLLQVIWEKLPVKNWLKNSSHTLHAQAQRHPLAAGVIAAVGFTLILNMNALVAAVSLPLLLSTLPCLLMMGFCMKGGKGCDAKSSTQPVENEAAALEAPHQVGQEKFDA